MTTRPIIQIAGVMDQREAFMLCDSGATHIGFPMRLAHHQEDLPDRQARDIIGSLPAGVSKVLITYLRLPAEIVELARYLGVDTVQIHSNPTRDDLAELRKWAPDLQIIRSLIVGEVDPADLAQEARSQSELVDFFLTDTYDPETGARGATGKTHDWAVSRFLASRAGRPLILAGGLNATNVRRAIFEVAPAGVDAHTGVEGPDGRKNRQLVEAFIREAQLGFQGGAP
ncbi:MAG: phosphoribosylanthranilate isomerase [Acidobacteria bacterium]|nr:MAG: phosphoribosylanthranilate isomerase [Acidobacteriota bacterium]